jgi:hypothetical protein
MRVKDQSVYLDLNQKSGIALGRSVAAMGWLERFSMPGMANKGLSRAGAVNDI